MSNGIPPVRSDVVTVPSVARPTPTPVRVSFGEVLAKGASTLVAGAEAAMESLPGGSLVAAAIRGGGSSVGNMGPASTMSATGHGNMGLATNAEGPTGIGGSSVGGGFGGGTGMGTGTGVASGSLDQSLQQSQEMNMYFLQIQQEVNAQNQTFTTLSNVMKSEADTIKNAIGNLR
jgi:hypothetical protein